MATISSGITRCTTWAAWAEAGVHYFPAEAVGHSVRALLCYTGLTAFCREAAEPAYEQAAGWLWATVPRAAIAYHLTPYASESDLHRSV